MASSSSGLAQPPRRSRPPELEDPLNRYVYHPLSRRLARGLQPTGISPDAVSVAGMLLVWGAAAAYAGLGSPQGVLIGLALHLLWHVVDGADGDLARLIGRTSPTGELVDGACDYTGHFVLYVVLAVLLEAQIGVSAWALASAAAASRVFQSNHSESHRRFYLWWVYEVPWLKQAKRAGDEVFERRSWFNLYASGFARLYLRITSWMSPSATRIDRAVDAAQGDPERRRRIAEAVRARSAHLLTLQKLLGANLRTLILGASMALGTPLYFFLAEAVLLNLLLLWSIRRHERTGADILEAIGERAHRPDRSGL